MADVQEKRCKVSQSGCIPRSVARVRKGGSLVERTCSWLRGWKLAASNSLFLASNVWAYLKARSVTDTNVLTSSVVCLALVFETAAEEIVLKAIAIDVLILVLYIPSAVTPDMLAQRSTFRPHEIY